MVIAKNTLNFTKIPSILQLSPLPPLNPPKYVIIKYVVITIAIINPDKYPLSLGRDSSGDVYQKSLF